MPPRLDYLGSVANVALGNYQDNAQDSQSALQRHVVHLPEALTAKLHAHCQDQALSLRVVLQGVWALLLSRYSGESDVRFAIVTDAPQRFLPVMVAVPSDSTCITWLRQLQDQGVNRSQEDDRPLGQVQPLAHGETSGETSSILGESLVQFAEADQANQLPGSQWFAIAVISTLSSSLTLVYDSRWFAAATIVRMAGHLQTLLEGVAANPDQMLATVPMLTATEAQQLLVEWNTTAADYPTDPCLHQLFEAQVARTPDAIALMFEQQHLTYGELNARSNQLAHHLRSLGIVPDTLVGICVERSLEMVVGLLGVLKAGGAYVPIDPGYPIDRIAHMLQDSQLAVLLTQTALRDRLPDHTATTLYLDHVTSAIETQPVDNPQTPVQPENLAYVIYTSGSTGKPKGVMIPHRAICNHMHWMQATFPVSATDKILQKTPFSFDASVWEFYAPLLAGGQLVVARPDGHRDPAYLINTIVQQAITVIQFVPSLLQALLLNADFQRCQSLKHVFCGGEALPTQVVQRFYETLSAKLHNLYGPTETTIDATYFTCQPDDTQRTVAIGRPIANNRVYVLDRHYQPVPIGVPGELYIGGAGVGSGYLNRPELTAERFVPNPLVNPKSKIQNPKSEINPKSKIQNPKSDLSVPSADRLYKTGDLVSYRPDGNLEFLGRIDFQVKLRGFRIELGEIEVAVAAHPTVQQVVVIAREDQPGDQRLVAYVVAKPGATIVPEDLRSYLQQTLPDYMVPAAIVAMESFPLTPSGKVDRRALPVPVIQRSSLSQSYSAPKSELEATLASIWANVLGVTEVGTQDNFFELGGSSILTLQVVTQIQQRLGIEVSVVKLFQYSTIAQLAAFLSPDQPASPQGDRYRQRSRPRQTETTGVAIVGMAGRFPGAMTVDDLWRNLCDGVESITVFRDEELDPSIDPALRQLPNYIKANGVMADADKFDAAFFGINPREAEVMDPQQRVFLEICWAALENAGYDADSFPGLIGVYVGMGNNTYYQNNVATRRDLIDQLGTFQVATVNEKDYIATRVSYKLNLRGPSLSIHTACSTSLVAVSEAFHALMTDRCDMALSGGISISVPQNTGYLYQEGAMLSGDGHCRPFDAQASGTLFSNGAGVVVLKRLEDALADGDQIYAVIKGAGTNNDGGNKMSFAAPSVEGQAGAIAAAHAYADFHPETITYVETHGTATPLGDPIELEALSQVFRAQTNAKQFCAIGSIKSNVGHLVAAAGVAGLIKTTLALKHKLIPPTLHYQAPNPRIDFANSPFFVNAQLTEWQARATPRRAGVSSFGVGGTNAHVVLEEPPVLAPSSPSRPYQLLLLSAKTQTALDAATVNLKQHLTYGSDLNLADVAYTLQVGRKGFNYRRFVVCRNEDEAVSALESLPPQQSGTRYASNRNPEVVFMFPGQGSQYVNMGLNLYQQEPLFRETVDRCAEILNPHLGRDLRDVLYPQSGGEDAAAEILRNTFFTQPALFVIEYALAQLWLSWGIKPSGMIGHSIGEFTAACLAGVFSLEDALRLVATRGRLMQDLPGGAMLSVRAAAAAVEPWLTGDLAIAAINAPNLCVVSGSHDAIAALQQTLEANEIVAKPLHTSHAFHSPMMDPIVEPFAAVVRTIALHPPQLPFVSTVTTDWITPDQATDPMYWANHLRATVRFADGIQSLWQNPEWVLLEVGPRTTAATLARRQVQDMKKQVAISSLSDTAENQAEWEALLQAVGQLWLAGATIDWQAFYRQETRHRVPLPTYPFDRKRFWAEPNLLSASSPVLAEATQPIPPPSTLTSPPSTPHPQPLGATMPATQVMTTAQPRQQRLIPLLKEIVENTSGLELDTVDESATFLEMGLDSLTLTQVGLALQKTFNIKVTFRQLLKDLPNLRILADFLDSQLPPDAFPAEAAPAEVIPVTQTEVATPTSAAPEPAIATPTHTLPPTPYPPHPTPHTLPAPYPQLSTPNSALESVIAQQLQLMARQLELLGASGVPAMSTYQAAAPQLPQTTPQPAAPQPTPVASTMPDPAQPQPQSQSPASQPPSASTETASNETAPKKVFGAGARIDTTERDTLTPQQRTNLEAFMRDYIARTGNSKHYAQTHRPHLADPRAVSGFNRMLKEVVYPIVGVRSAGSRLWDLDGNEYVDLNGGFGSNFFGNNVPFINAAIAEQLSKGFEIGPQTVLAGEVAQLFCEMTNMERAAFCNTGSEAVLGAMRMARTVTGRNTIVMFTGDYHGITDEVIVRGSKKLKSFPAAPGIPSSAVENMLVLDYAEPASLEILKARADEFAAIMVEPVQSRRPDLQPREFLHQLRDITTRSGAAFIVDEVITGFRMHPAGAQGYFEVQADIGTYGKVVGGGMPIGVIAGKQRFMDALDGGFWQFGDESIPEVGVTYFAGTFVRHPLTMAAAKAALLYLKQEGPELQRTLNQKTDHLAATLNALFQHHGAPFTIVNFGSMFRINYTPDFQHGELLFYWLRHRGIHIWDHRSCFLTLAHTDEDIAFIINAFKQSLGDMRDAGFLPEGSDYAPNDNNANGSNSNSNGKAPVGWSASNPPIPGAKLGRDPQGNPAWFVPDPDRPGKYLQVATTHNQ